MTLVSHPLDVGILAAYLIGIVGLGCWAGWRQRARTERGTAYFLAGGTLRWPIIGLAMFSTNISTIHLVSLAQAGYDTGLAMGNFEWMAAFTLILLALFFAPFYIRARVATLPDFLEKRYSRHCRDWFALVSIVSAIAVHIGFSLYTSAVILKALLGIPLLTTIIAIAVLTGLYTAIGGLLAVVLTESIQTVLLLLGAFIITGVGLVKAGGWAGLVAHVEPVKLTLLRPSGDASDLPWYSVMLGYPVLGIWYWCTDQTIVQRILGAKDENHARVGPLFAGFLKILPVFIIVLPGLIALALVRQGKIPAALLANSEDTYAVLIQRLLPVGLRGLVAAGLVAAVMSTVSGALNSIATLFSYDLYKRFKPEASDRSLVRVGRIVTAVAMLAAILWSPWVGHFGSLFAGLNKVIGYIAPPITAVFVCGVFWARTSARAALITLWTGSALGLAIFVLDWFGYVKDFEHKWGYHVPFLMVPTYLCLVCGLLLVLLSLIYPHQHTPESARLVWPTPLDALRGHAWRGLRNYKFLAALLLATMVGLYAFFR
jgi:solute:Na+ symporter, SSS family